MKTSTIILLVLLVVVIGLVLIVLSYITTWVRAWLSGAPVSISNLIAMQLRGVPYKLIVEARITAVKAGIEIETDKIESHYLAEGNIIETMQALIAADKAGIRLSWDWVCAIDLATKGTGKSVLEAVRTSINSEVIDVPAASGGHNA